PFNLDAEAMKSKARGASYRRKYSYLPGPKAEENLAEDIDEQTISYAPLVLYPRNWDQISRRAEASALGGSKSQIKKVDPNTFWNATPDPKMKYSVYSAAGNNEDGSKSVL